MSMDDHPELQAPDLDNGMFVEAGWMAVKFYISVDEPDVVHTAWTSEGLDFFRQLGILTRWQDYLKNRGSGMECGTDCDGDHG